MTERGPIDVMGVYVLGTGQSGTSAASRLVNLLGVPTSRSDDVMDAPSEDNARGYWESAALLEINEELLAELGGTGRATPRLQPGWEKSASLASLRDRAAAEHARVFPTAQWVWKDPRNCTTLPFWRSVLPGRSVAVVVSRNPLEVVSSLQRHLGATKLYGLARWEQRTRDLLHNIDGMPAIFTTFEDLLADPVSWSGSVSAFLRAHDVHTSTANPEAITSFVEPTLRHAAHDEADLRNDPDVSDQQLELDRIVRDLSGPRPDYRTPDLPPETPWAEIVMAEYRTGYVRELEVARDWLTEQVRSWENQAAELRRWADELENNSLLRSAVRRLTKRIRPPQP